MKIFNLLIIGFFTLLLHPLNGQEPGGITDKALGVRLMHENDVLAPPYHTNTDDNYTGGVKLEVRGTNLLAKPPRFLNITNGKITSQSISFGFTIFTPQDLAADTIIYSDRPYASYQGFEFESFSLNKKHNLSVLYGVFIGQFGGSFGGNLQSTAHENHWLWSTRPIPRGWHYQIANGGSISVNGNLRLEKGVYFFNKEKRFQPVSLVASGNMNVGSYLTSLEISPRLNILSYNGTLSSNYIPEIQALDGSEKHPKLASHFQCELYVKPIVKYVAWNGMLNGRWINETSPHVVPHAKLNPFLLEFEYGGWFRYRFFTLGYKVKSRSKEFNFQNKEWHHWGSLFIGTVIRLN